MSSLDLKKLRAHRARAFGLPPARRISTKAQALRFVDARGYIFFWPIKGIDFPSLWTAVAGDRPVADEHDDPGHVTWGWKDDALDKRIWYYAKVLRRKATIISLEVAPYFYALSENYGSPQEDYLIAYDEGHFPQSAKQVYEALLAEGALNTVDLRRAAKLGNAKESEFNRALAYLQADFKILPVGVANAGAWHYSHIYEIVARHFPDLPKKARKISELKARAKLLELYVLAVGAAQARQAVRLFGWRFELAERAIEALRKNGTITVAGHPKNPGEWLALPALCR